MNLIPGSTTERHNIWHQKDPMLYGIGMIQKVGTLLEEVLEEQSILGL